MRSKPVIARVRTNLDVDDAIDYYLGEGALAAALGFIEMLERAYVQIDRQPGTGATRYAHELNLPGRSRPLTRSVSDLLC